MSKHLKPFDRAVVRALYAAWERDSKLRLEDIAAMAGTSVATVQNVTRPKRDRETTDLGAAGDDLGLDLAKPQHRGLAFTFIDQAAKAADNLISNSGKGIAA